MNNYKSSMGAVPIRMALATLIVASLLAVPGLTLANNHTDSNESNGQGRAYGRSIVVPPIILFLSHWEEEYGWLPPGLARLLERFEDHFGPIDDDDDDDDTNDEDPELENVTEVVGVSTTTLQFEFSEDVQARLFVGSEAGFANNDDGVIRQSHTDYESEHEFVLEELEAETEYFYRVRYRDEDGNAVMSDEMSFITDAEDDDSGEEDTTDPEVASSTVDVGTSTAELNIEFSEPVQVTLLVSEVDGFDEETDDLMTFEETDFLEDHTFELDGLNPNSEYFYRLNYEDEAGNSVEGSQNSFTTEAEEEDTTAPNISDVSGEAGTTTIIVSFTSNEPATAKLYTATSSGFAIGDAGVILTEETTLQTEHELTIEDLTASTTYYHIIEVEDEAGNTAQSAEITLGTL